MFKRSAKRGKRKALLNNPAALIVERRQPGSALSFLATLIFTLLCLTPAAHAHLLNMTELHLDASEPGRVVLRVRIDLGQSLMQPRSYWDMATAQQSEQAELLVPVTRRLTQGLTVRVDDRPVIAQLQSWQFEAASLGAISNPLTPQMAELIFALKSPALTANSTLEVSVGDSLEIPWPALLRVDSADLALPVSRLLTASERSSRPISLNAQSQASNTSALTGLALSFQRRLPGLSWIAVGFQHIIPSGLDHIVFVLGLFFLSTSLSTLIYQVSCFTVAHSLTLGLATLGFVSVPASIVEPLIAASIMYIAVDNLYRDSPGRWRLMIVTLFGLLHGLGFASALSELTLPEGSFFATLVLFNLGVELGQLTVLLVAFAALGWLRGWTGYYNRIARPATITIAGIGAYWLVKRVVF